MKSTKLLFASADLFLKWGWAFVRLRRVAEDVPRR